MEYEAVIGLETHVQLKTKSKMWCGCANTFGAEPNTNVCPVCLGMPGVLPVANEEALRLTVLTGLLLNCEIPPRAKFDRKNYFYPDVAKNYQITQYDQPSTKNGYVEFEFNGGLSRVHITRAHLEEDVGKNFHFDRNSGVDFNRAGVPLMEIVSEPDLTSADQAYDYLNALIEILRYGKISDCDMEKGMVRCDVNVSVRPIGTKELGAKIEIKNMNSFSGARRALEYEIPRQIAAAKRGEKLIQSTRRWDDVAEITEEMRTKEHAHDYRYFPEPDLMPLAPTDEWLAEVKSRVVELPLARKQRFMRDYQLPAPDAETFVNDMPLGNYFEPIAKKSKNPKAVANWVINNLRAKMSAMPLTPSLSPSDGERVAKPGEGFDNLKFKPEAILELVNLVDTKTISSSTAQTVFAEMFETGKSPATIVQEKGLAQVSDTGAIEKFCDDAIAANPNSVADYKSGKVAALNFLKGQVMKLSKGKANPNLIGEILEKETQDVTCMDDEIITDVSSLDFETWIKFVFDHPVIKYPGDSWHWSSGERFVATNPHRLLEHFTRLCLDFPEIASRYTLQQIDQGIWFLLSEPIRSGVYLVLATIPLNVRLECIRSMYHVYSDFVAKSKVAVMENCFDMWWDLACGDCWSELKHSPPRRNIEECVGGYEKLTTDEKAVLDTIYETLAKILELKEQRCIAYALHGLGHLHHPLGKNLVQKFINDNRSDFTPDGIKWLESCRDGTVM